MVSCSTGKAFCGNYGSVGKRRREYTVIGDAVNLGARLMQHAKTEVCFVSIGSSQVLNFLLTDSVRLGDSQSSVLLPCDVRTSRSYNSQR